MNKEQILKELTNTEVVNGQLINLGVVDPQKLAAHLERVHSLLDVITDILEENRDIFKVELEILRNHNRSK